MLPGQGAVLPLDVARLCDVARLRACLWDSDSRAVSEPVFGTRRACLSRLSLRLSGPASVRPPPPTTTATSPSPPAPRPWSEPSAPPPRAARGTRARAEKLHVLVPPILPGPSWRPSPSSVEIQSSSVRVGLTPLSAQRLGRGH